MSFKSRLRMAITMCALLAAGMLSVAVAPVQATVGVDCTGTATDLKALVATQRTFVLTPLSLACSTTDLTSVSWTYSIRLGAAATNTDIFVDQNGTLALIPANSDAAGLPVDLATVKLKADTTGTYPLEIIATASGQDPTPTAATATDVYAFTLTTVSTLPTAPTCKFEMGNTSKDVPFTQEISYNPTTDLGCKSADSTLAFTVSSPNHGSVQLDTNTDPSAPVTATFTPTAGWVEPQDFSTDSQRASYVITATDAFGQTISATQIVSVVKPRACAITAPLKEKSQVIFNNPDGSVAEQFKITNKMLGYIDCAQPNSVITMSWFSLTDPNVVQHLKLAYSRRNINVRFLINSHASTNQNFHSILRTLGGSPAKNARNGNIYVSGNGGSWALYCNHGCLTPPAPPGLKFSADSEAEYPALHAKFFMVSNIGKGVSVMGVGSNNPTRAQAIQGWNNMQIIVETKPKLKDHKIFQAFSAYFAKLSSQGISKTAKKTLVGNKKPASYSQLTSLGQTYFTTFPRPSTANSDDATSLFRQVKCQYRDASGKMQRTQIYINMFVFTRNSPAMSLWHLANNPTKANGGCQIHIIYTDMDSAIKLGSTYLNKRNGYVSYGVADCLSTSPTLKGKYHTLTVPTRRKVYDSKGNVVKVKGKVRYENVLLCSRGALQGSMPTINYGRLCWLHTYSRISGGTIDACASSYMTLTRLDPADGRTKLEAWKGADGLTKFSHQKYILINGMVHGKVQQLTYSGTPNLTSPGLRYNDEIMITTTDSSIFNLYYKNFQTMQTWVTSRSNLGKYPNNCGIYTTC